MRTASTRWEWRKLKIEPAARPRSKSRAAGPSAEPRNPRKPLTVQLVYRGGAEAWWEIRDGRGKFRFPGWVCLHDALEAVNRGEGYSAH